MERLCLQCGADISHKFKKAKVCSSQCYTKWYWRKKGSSLSKERSEYQRLYREKNKDSLKENHKKWYEKNKASVRLKNSEYYKENASKIKRNAKDWREKNEERKKQADREGYRKNLKKRMVSAAKKRAAKIGIPFSLEENDFEIPKLCPALGIELKVSNTLGPAHDSPTLDRIEPALGYVKGNVKVISCRANRIKTDATVDELYAVAIWLENEVCQ